ncbi:MAG: hypothetical protein LBB76_10270, partial [Azoarcus sp.]|nr:hypothetical protein [Azoarcus sp.]
MRGIATQSNPRTAAQAPVMNNCRITPSAHPTYQTYPTYETTSLRASQTIASHMAFDSLIS